MRVYFWSTISVSMLRVQFQLLLYKKCVIDDRCTAPIKLHGTRQHFAQFVDIVYQFYLLMDANALSMTRCRLNVYFVFVCLNVELQPLRECVIY